MAVCAEKMESRYFLLPVLLLLLGDYAYSANSVVETGQETAFDTKGLDRKNNTSDEKIDGLNPGLNSAAKEVTGKPSGRSNEGFENNTSTGNSSKQLEFKETRDVQTKKASTAEKLPVKKSERKHKSGDGLESKEAPVGKTNEGALVNSAPLRKGSSRGEECDSSDKCSDDKNNFVACLRVPGNESPDLSLLIQNKVKGPLTVAISAPDFVQLEKKKIELQGKEDGKVKVSFEKGGTGSAIILTAGDGSCRLDFRRLMGQHSMAEMHNAPKLNYAGFMSRRTPSVAAISLAALLVFAFACACMRLRRRRFSGRSFKYQKVDSAMPVSAATEAESNTNDGWDNTWGDGWDDEEAAVTTPTMPTTPSVSAKGLTPRRFNKEGWKD